MYASVSNSTATGLFFIFGFLLVVTGGEVTPFCFCLLVVVYLTLFCFASWFRCSEGYGLLPLGTVGLVLRWLLAARLRAVLVVL